MNSYDVLYLPTYDATRVHWVLLFRALRMPGHAHTAQGPSPAWTLCKIERPAPTRAARHLRNLAKTKNGPPAHALRKAVVTVFLPTALYGAECWYGGRTKPAPQVRGDKTTSSAKVGWHLETFQKTINAVIMAALPV